VLREPVCEKRRRQGFGPRYRTPGEPAIRDDQNIGRSAWCPPVAATVAVAATNELRDGIINFNTLNRQAKCMFLDKPSCSSAIIVQPRLCPFRPPPQSPGVRKSVFVQLGVTIAAAYILLRFIDRPVSTLRNWVRQRDGRPLANLVRRRYRSMALKKARVFGRGR
jgi:hypothetical protein